MVLPIFKVNLSSLVNSLWKDLHRHLLGNTESVELTIKVHCHKLLVCQFGRNDTFLKCKMRTKEYLACQVSIWCVIHFLPSHYAHREEHSQSILGNRSQ